MTDQRKAKGEESKKKIIEAAISIVSLEGSKGLSAKKISDIAGISKSNVFHHFGSVEGIMEEIMRSISSSYFEPVNDGDFESLESFFDLLGNIAFNLNEKEITQYKVVFSFYNDTMFKDKFKSDLRNLKKRFADYLRESVLTIEKIEIDNELAELIAIDLDGLGLHFLIEEDFDKYIKLWSIKSVMYIKEIRRISKV